ncbi:MAG TPA: tRNA uridine-5-carboxymethylaminomethyl(34) synthesis GTPase MnmE [Candidatus Limnocylindrales bacterium]|nr:tRNA uridine-5-carboxymethylaminomethyl(34) synthesis GTPase MnmE [Candidatus Limnocylindrales bacterium]
MSRSLYRADTIVACATAAGRGAIAIVRWSGTDSLAIAGRIFVPATPGPIEPWKMRLGTVLGADGSSSIDQVLGVFFPAAFSFSGEDTFEVHSHGSPVVVEQIVASAIAAGARAAERGEFTRRAVLNGKLDLLQAEAIADLIHARMAAGARSAWRQLQGALSSELEELRTSLIAVLADIEAQADFTDDELPDPDLDRRSRTIELVLERAGKLLDGFAASRRQRDGFRVVFTGRPNAGKSSLVNRLLGSGRMIVSDEPGTTRDVVEEVVDLGGIAFVLVDTAGIRDAPGGAEAEAIRRAHATLEEADICVHVLDGSQSVSDVKLAADGDTDSIVLLNKCDLGLAAGPGGERWAGASVVVTSAVTGQGCDELVERLTALARRRLENDAPGISRIRHRAALERMLLPLQRARDLAASEEMCDLAAIELRGALAELAAIRLPLDNEEVLDRIFSEFCIGK